MKKSILTGVVAIAAGAAGLMAQATPPTAPAAPAGPKQPAPKSQAELTAIQTMFAAQQKNDLDAVIKAADELMTKFADTEFKELALYMEAEAYSQKGDNTKAQVYSEQALALNPKSYQASIMLAELVVKQTRENDLDREEKLGKVEKYSKDAIEYVKDVPKPRPDVPDEQWSEFKKGIIARAHNAIGMGQLVRKKYDAAAAEFKLAVDNDPQPTFMVRQASALQSLGKNEEASALCDKILADPTLHPQIKQVAQQIKAATVKK
jgi:tetratricopeptide (TPR) repeat protein